MWYVQAGVIIDFVSLGEVRSSLRRWNNELKLPNFSTYNEFTRIYTLHGLPSNWLKYCFTIKIINYFGLKLAWDFQANRANKNNDTQCSSHFKQPVWNHPLPIIGLFLLRYKLNFKLKAVIHEITIILRMLWLVFLI